MKSLRFTAHLTACAIRTDQKKISRHFWPKGLHASHCVLLAAFACAGCTHRQLSRSMLNQASTVMTIEYRMVLDNIAMFTYNPSVLPWAIRINDGTVQVNDEGGMAEFGVQWGSTPGITLRRASHAQRFGAVGCSSGDGSAGGKDAARCLSPGHRLDSATGSTTFGTTLGKRRHSDSSRQTA